MTLEDLMLEGLKADAAIASLLTTYNNEPAVFYQHSPDDNDPAWSGANYPRINFYVQWRADPKRGTAGDAIIEIWCREEDVFPEDIEVHVKNHFNGLFLNANLTPSACEWEQSEGIVLVAPSNIIGVSMTFGIWSFATPESTYPDPTFAMREWLRDQDMDIQIISNHMPARVKATDKPAIFIENGTVSKIKETMAWIWLETNINVFVFAEDEMERIWLEAIFARIIQAGSIDLPTGHTILFKDERLQYSKGMQDQGQIELTGEYVVSRYEPYAHKLNHVYMSAKGS